jgi:hypothetical protein
MTAAAGAENKKARFGRGMVRSVPISSAEAHPDPLRQLIGSPVHPRFNSGQGVEFGEKFIGAGWWLIAVQGAIG